MITDLLTMLGRVEETTLIGWCIKQALNNEKNEELLYSLKEMARHHPDILADIIGQEAFSLLISGKNDLLATHQHEMQTGTE